MQPHQNDPLRGTLLELADAGDQLGAWASRARVQAMANGARLLAGLPPITFPTGPASPHEVVDEGPLARLLHLPATGAQRRGTPLVVVASLINRWYVLDLLPERSLLADLGRRGFDVYVLDWKAPGAAGPDLRFEDYIEGAITGAVQFAARASKSPRTALLGYCMGGTLATIFAARHPEAVQSLALLGTPIDFHQSGELARWTDPARFDADLVIDVFGNMPPWLMQSGFKLLSPFDALARATALQRSAGDEKTLRQLVALEAWLDDNSAFPGGVYRDYIRRLYQENALIADRFPLAGRPVELRALVAPLLNVVALRDRICAPPSSRALMDRVGSSDRKLLEFDTGHIGLTTSSRAQAELWPQIGDWLVERCGK
jgi:polyhydroxyalkanoate synthase